MNADDLVIGGKNTTAPETRIVACVRVVTVFIITVWRKLILEISHEIQILTMTNDETIMTKE